MACRSRLRSIGLELIPEAGVPAVSTATGQTLGFRQVLAALGDARDKDRAIGLGFRIDGSVSPGFVQTGPFVASVRLNEGLDREVPGPSLAAAADQRGV